MTLSGTFSPFEQLQNTIRLSHNKIVNRYFKDLENHANPNSDEYKRRNELKIACRIMDSDTASMMMLRLHLFYEIIGYGKKRLGVFYGIPSLDFQESFEGRPQIFLYFSQDRESTPDGLPPITAEISFRLINETSQSITPAKARTIANEIKREMIEANKGIVFVKGSVIVNYNDRKNGFKLQIYSLNESEGTSLIKKIIAIRNVPFDSDKLSVSTSKRTPVNVPVGSTTVYGKPKRKRRWRPTARVRFRQAYMYIHGLNETVPLVDTTGQWFDSLVSA